MSRSYKHHPIFHGAKSKYGKNLANRHVRRIPATAEVSNYGWYKKNYEQYDIYDYWSRQTEEQWRRSMIKDLQEDIKNNRAHIYYSYFGHEYWRKYYYSK